MHESVVTRMIVDMVLSECEKNSIRRPVKVVAELGELTNYRKESVLFYYELFRKEFDLLKDAVLDIKCIKGQVLCNDCNKKSRVLEPCLIFCQSCGSYNVSIIHGKEFYVREIDVSD